MLYQTSAIWYQYHPPKKLGIGHKQHRDGAWFVYVQSLLLSDSTALKFCQTSGGTVAKEELCVLSISQSESGPSWRSQIWLAQFNKRDWRVPRISPLSLLLFFLRETLIQGNFPFAGSGIFWFEDFGLKFFKFFLEKKDTLLVRFGAVELFLPCLELFISKFVCGSENIVKKQHLLYFIKLFIAYKR